jgi:hypothetical protein
MARPVHTGIHRFVLVPGELAHYRVCDTCGFTSMVAEGRHQCSGIWNVLGRPVTKEQDLTGREDAPVRVGAVTPIPNGLRAAAPRPVKNRRRGISPATPDQRLKARGAACVVCGLTSLEATIDPSHLIPRGMTTVGQDDERAVVPLCRRCHDAYDREQLDLSSHLEPGYREEVAFAVERVGLFAALRRITNSTWAPTERAA